MTSFLVAPTHAELKCFERGLYFLLENISLGFKGSVFCLKGVVYKNNIHVKFCFWKVL